MQQPLFSIVIANYNYGRFLEEAIQSVLTQSYQDFELIVVDGGSTDNSVEIIKRYADRIAWWCSEHDKGQSDAFNKGFAHAQGVFGCWLNADDLMMPGALQAVSDFKARHPKSNWICGGTVFMGPDKTVLWCSRGMRIHPLMQRFHRWLPASVNGPSSFFQLSRLRSVNGFDMTLHLTMDIDLWRRFWKAGELLDFVDQYLWSFRIHEASKTAYKFKDYRRYRAFLGLKGGKGDNSLLSFTMIGRGDQPNEGQLVNARHGCRRIMLRVGGFALIIAKLVSLTYLLSWLDTRRFRGKAVECV